MKLYNDDNVTSVQSHEQLHQNLLPGKYAACLYPRVWYIGAVIERSDQNKDAYIKFMKRNHLVLIWPQDLQNDCWVPFTDILTIIAPPQLQGHSGRNYVGCHKVCVGCHKVCVCCRTELLIYYIQ